MKKVYKIIISVVSLAIVVGIIFMIKTEIEDIKLWNYSIEMTSFQSIINNCKKYILEYIIFIIIETLTILLLAFFNFLLWFKALSFMPLTAEQKAERKKILRENKVKKLQEKLNKLN